MAAGIEIDGKRYKVVESVGYNRDIGGYVKIVTTLDGEKTAVKQGRRSWRFWTARDRVQPLVDAIERGWPNDGAAVRGQ